MQPATGMVVLSSGNSQSWLGDWAGVPNVHKGQVAEEEVHRGMKLRASSDQHNYADIAQYSGEVDPQEQYKEDGTKGGVLG